MFFYSKDKIVKMISPEAMTMPGYDELEYTPSADEQVKIDAKYNLSVKDGVLYFETPATVANANIETAKASLKAKALDGTLTLEDVRLFIVDVL